ncbi:hypothetical protein ACMAY5_06875 [Arenicellales bacterium nBUS_48]
MRKNIQMQKAVSFYLISKIGFTGMMLLVLPIFFGQTVFRLDDFVYYLDGGLGLGPNIGYRWLIALLGVNSLNEPLPIFLASTLNILIDVIWLYMLREHLTTKGLLVLALALGLQPYLATYSMKFSSIIFAKIGILYFIRQLFADGFQKAPKRGLSSLEIIMWLALTAIRNSNLFIAAPYIFMRMRKNIWVGLLMASVFVSVFYFLSLGYLSGLDPSNRPWSLDYVRNLIGIDSNLIALPILIVARILILFGAREKLYNDGLEPFLVWGMPGLELAIYFVLSLIQLIGFFAAINFLVAKYGKPSLLLLIPLLLALFTVVHQRYLIPFIPICLFGLALLFDQNRRTNK